MPTIDGTFEAPASRDRVWALLRDLPSVAPLIPGCEGIEILSPTSFRGTVRVKVGPISARFGGTMTILEERPPEFISARLEGRDSGTASLLKVRASLRLDEAAPDRTLVAYHAEVEVLGRLGSYGWALMHKKAAEQLAAFGEAVRQRLAGGGGTSS